MEAVNLFNDINIDDFDIDVCCICLEDMVDNMVSRLVRDVRRDPLDYLKNYGLDFKEYIDEDALAQGLVDSDGWGIMNSYDGNYDSVDVAGETYYIMRIN